jgi:spermidine synthase
MELTGRWHFELVTTDLMMVYRINDILHTGKTSYQTVDVLDTGTFGRSLVLDGKTQSTETDEHIYHEALVHPALLFHPRPEAVFIGGGGEGATLREVLRHNVTQRVVMLDLDSQVVDVCRRFLPNHHQGAFDNPKVELRHEDARQYLASCQESFDVMILDLVDPIEGGPSYLLYTREFYNIARSKLRPGGILVTQAGPAGPLNHTECFTAISRTLSEVFPQTYAYNIYVPAFTTPWGFVIALNDNDNDAEALPGGAGLDELEPESVDTLITQRLPGELRCYDGITHRSMFSLPKYLRQGIASEQRIVTDDNPVFMT